MRLMGCAKTAKQCSDFADMLMLLISRDYTDQPKFLGSVSQWWTERINAREAGLVCAKTLGVETPSRTHDSGDVDGFNILHSR